MNPNQDQNRPATLVERCQYWLHDEPALECQPAAWLPVLFVGYTSCPGVVIVRGPGQTTRRVLRDDLYFTVLEPSAGGNPTEEPAALQT
jgi:hypothetical protein